MDFDIVNNHNPDVSVLYDNQIMDVVIEKAMKDIEDLCDNQNSSTETSLGPRFQEGINILNDDSTLEIMSPMFGGGASLLQSIVASKMEEPQFQ